MVLASILLLIINNFISVPNPPPCSPHSHLSTAWTKSKYGCQPTCSSLTVIKKSSWLWPQTLLQKIDTGCLILPSSEVCNLGVMLDFTLSFLTHVKFVTKTAFVPPKDHLSTSATTHWLCSRDPHPCFCHDPAGLLQWGPIWDFH